MFNFLQRFFCKVYRYFYVPAAELRPLNAREQIIDEANLTKIIYYYKDPKKSGEKLA